LNSVRILRALTRHPTLVALVALFSILIGFLVGFKPAFPPQSRSYTVAIASERLLIDTPQSQVLEAAPAGSATLGTRASVFANLLVVGELKNKIAERAGIDPKKLVGSTDASGGPGGTVDATKTTPTTPQLRTSVLLAADQVQLPIIKIEAQAPSPNLAAKLSSAAAAAISAYVNTKADSEGVTLDKRLSIRSLGAPQVLEETRGPRHMLAFVVALLMFVLGCTGIVLVPAFLRAWRLSVALDEPENETAIAEGGVAAPTPIHVASGRR
jgi:capsular polysaccharide biosynthesis protein